jgi:hypothetical protein
MKAVARERTSDSPSQTAGDDTATFEWTQAVDAMIGWTRMSPAPRRPTGRTVAARGLAERAVAWKEASRRRVTPQARRRLQCPRCGTESEGSRRAGTRPAPIGRAASKAPAKCTRPKTSPRVEIRFSVRFVQDDRRLHRPSADLQSTAGFPDTSALQWKAHLLEEGGIARITLEPLEVGITFYL